MQCNYYCTQFCITRRLCIFVNTDTASNEYGYSKLKALKLKNMCLEIGQSRKTSRNNWLSMSITRKISRVSFDFELLFVIFMIKKLKVVVKNLLWKKIGQTWHYCEEKIKEKTKVTIYVNQRKQSTSEVLSLRLDVDNSIGMDFNLSAERCQICPC